MDDLTEMANRILLINEGQLAFDGDYEQLIRMTGDNRVIKLTAKGEAPILSGATYVGTEEGKHLYRYDASKTSVSEIFGSISKIPTVEDVELGHEAIEQVIAKLYEDWRKGE
jgi:ABC-2 type transport system ATP-binding protein